MCTRMHLTCIFTSLIFCAHAGYVASILRNVSSHVVASRVCNQELYRMYMFHCEEWPCQALELEQSINQSCGTSELHQ